MVDCSIVLYSQVVVPFHYDVWHLIILPSCHPPHMKLVDHQDKSIVHVTVAAGQFSSPDPTLCPSAPLIKISS